MNLTLQSELEWRLKNWKYWRLDGLSGYPDQSTIAHFGEGINLPITYSHPPFPLNQLLAQEMGAWINQMGSSHIEYKYVIELVYLTGHPQWKLAQMLNISPRDFTRRLQCARTWLEGRLSIDSDENKKNIDIRRLTAIELDQNRKSLQKTPKYTFHS